MSRNPIVMTANSDPEWKPAVQTRTIFNPEEYGPYVQPIHLPTKVDPWTANHRQEETVQSIEKSERRFYRPPESLLPVHIGSDLVDVFAKLSEHNTDANIETVGILAGSIRNDSFYLVTHLIIPHQKGTHDTCEVLNDEIMPAMLSDLELVQLGWIHVHPKYEAFLSSVDLHSHFSYQMMLPESIAIVWAPISEPDYGIFTLTTAGMEEIGSCTQRGFHKHNNTNTFQNASHVIIDNAAPSITVADLR